MGKKYYKIVITGSDNGSKTAWFFLKLILKDKDTKLIFVSPSSKAIPTSFDGLVISGGADIDPLLYSNKRHPSVKNIEPKRDKMELKLLEIATKHHTPIFGICRGMQLINVFFKGTLIQHIYDLNLKYSHYNTIFPLKRIHILNNTKLKKIVKKSTLYVNSLHHQAVDRVGKGLKINSYDRNKIVEGIESTNDSFLLGVQWHPEYLLYIKEQRELFYSFKRAVSKQRWL